MSQEVKIGKYTLESLTVGMYQNPMVVFREYIQNAVDSIDQAVERKVIDFDQHRIDVQVKDNQVSIRDNGIGIKKDVCRFTLLDVGNSQKRFHKNRGFRGIGRLSGLIFCENLTFLTSYKGEPYKSAIQFNCDRLRDLLVPGVFEAYDIIDILLNVSSFSVVEDDKDAHYFEVKLSNIDPNHQALLDESAVRAYLTQVAPVPFDPQVFTLSEKIYQFIHQEQLKIDEYNIFLNGEQVFKPYTDLVTVGQGNARRKEAIKDIQLHYDRKVDYLAWFPIFDMKGPIQSPDVRGLRYRKGNILIGGEKSLDLLFENSPLPVNQWILGEIHVFNHKLIPNAHRDNFETVAKIYTDFIESLQPLAEDLLNRAQEDFQRGKIQREIRRQQKLVLEARQKIETGFASNAEKLTTIDDLIVGRKKLDRIKTQDATALAEIQVLRQDFDEVLAQLKNDPQESERLKKMKREQRNILRVVLEVLADELDAQNYSQIADKILSQFNGKKVEQPAEKPVPESAEIESSTNSNSSIPEAVPFVE